jgi:hypothetical protein
MSMIHHRSSTTDHQLAVTHHGHVVRCGCIAEQTVALTPCLVPSFSSFCMASCPAQLSCSTWIIIKIEPVDTRSQPALPVSCCIIGCESHGVNHLHCMATAFTLSPACHVDAVGTSIVRACMSSAACDIKHHPQPLATLATRARTRCHG